MQVAPMKGNMGASSPLRWPIRIFVPVVFAAALLSGFEPDPGSAAPFAFASPIRHIVVIYQENHSFDNVLGPLCVQDARCDGATTGKTHDGRTIPLARGEDIIPPMPHDNATMELAIHGGAMDGWSLISKCKQSTGYRCFQAFTPNQVPNYSALARRFVISDRTFQDHNVPTWLAHVDLVAGTLNGFRGENPAALPGNASGPGWGCDSLKDAPWRAAATDPWIQVPSCMPKADGSGPYRRSPVESIPTIMDRLDGAGLSWRIYGAQQGQGGGGYGWSICPTFANCINTPARQNFVSTTKFTREAKAGSLPNLSIVTPHTPESQHNRASMIRGDNYVGKLVDAAMNGPDWRSTAIFVTYDDCGCFFDHAAPPPGLGMRVPMVIVSPYAKPGFTDSRVASFASILAYIEHQYGVAPLTVRDRDAYDYSASFDYTQPPLAPVQMESNPLSRWKRRYLDRHPVIHG